jgi:hypothetical protein
MKTGRLVQRPLIRGVIHWYVGIDNKETKDNLRYVKEVGLAEFHDCFYDKLKETIESNISVYVALKH